MNLLSNYAFSFFLILSNKIPTVFFHQKNLVECKGIGAKQSLKFKKRGRDLGEEWGRMTRCPAGNQQLVVSSHAFSSVGFYLSGEKPISFLPRERMYIFGVYFFEL